MKGLLPAQTTAAPLPAIPGTAQVLGTTTPMDDTLHLRDILRVLIKRKWQILAMLLIGVCAGVLATFLVLPIYRGTVTLQIDRMSPRILDRDKDIVPAEAGDREFFQTQYELLRSRSLAERVIEEMGLRASGGHNVARTQAPGGPGEERLFNRIRAFVDDMRGIKTAVQASPEAEQQESTLSSFKRSLTIEPIRNSRLVKVHFDNPDPKLAAQVANTLSQAFINSTLERRFEASSYAKTFLEDKIKQTKTKLEESERALNTFSKEQALISLDDKRSIDSRMLEEYAAAFGKAEGDRIRYESLYRQIEENPNASTQILENKVIQTLKENKAKLESEYQDKLRVYKPAFPAMMQLESQIADIKKSIEEELRVTRNVMKSQYQAAKAQESELKSKLELAKKNILDVQGRSIQYNILKREVDTSRTLYDGLLQRLKEVGVQGGIEANNISVVDRAEVPLLPVHPSLSRNLLIGLLAGLMAGIALAFLLEYLDDSIKFADDVERVTGAPLLGVIPKIKEAPKDGANIALLAHIDPRSTLAEAYRSVRTALQFSTTRGAPRRFVVTSCTKGEGKSTTTLALSINFAQLGKPVLVIDCDMRNPTQHKLLGIDNQHGLSNYLSSDIDPVKITHRTNIPNLFAITAGPTPPNPVELLAGPRMLELLDAVQHRFSHIILDGPPVLGIADAIVLGNQVGDLVFVIESAQTRKAHIRTSIRRMHMSSIRPLGVVLTKTTAQDGNYGYEGSYYYYYYGEGPEKNAKRPRPTSSPIHATDAEERPARKVQENRPLTNWQPAKDGATEL